MPATQLIYTDTPNAQSDTYTIPPDLELVLSAVHVSVNGAGASGDFLPVLEILSQDGKLMVQARPDTTFAAGDTGRVSYSPF